VAIFLTAYLLPGIRLSGFGAALMTAVVLGLINVILKPIFILLTLPINILTLGLFTLVINTLLIMLTSAIVPGFQISNFWWALLFGIILSLIQSILTHVALG
jgi:putative membrane protein